MSSTHEIVTIQCGHYANFIGTHWWNMQEASFCYTENPERPLNINHDVLFREGLNPQGEVTFTPRLLAIDTKSNLKSLKKEGSLYDAGVKEDPSILWHEPPVVIQDEICEKNVFLKAVDQGGSILCSDAVHSPSEPFNLDKVVTVWSDYLKTQMHPRSICPIDEHSVQGDKNVIETYDYGTESYHDKYVQDMIEDRLRQYVEECDYLQGFHLLVDGDNAFTAVSNCILLHMDEEFKKSTKVVYPAFQKSINLLSQNEELKSYLHHLHSTLLGFNSFNNLSTCFCPLSLHSDVLESNDHGQMPFLNYKTELPYHTSAILATALETSTASYRLRKKKRLLSDIADNLVLYGRKLLSCGICLPFTFHESMQHSRNTVDDCQMQSVTPHFKPKAHSSLAQSAVLRGISDKVFRRMCTKSLQSIESEKEIFLGQYLSKCSPSALTFADILEEKCVLSTPFPNIITKEYLQNVEHSVLGSIEVPVAATLSNSDSASDILQEILGETKKHVTRLKCFYSAGSELEGDDFAEIIHNLVMLKENYGPNYSI